MDRLTTTADGTLFGLNGDPTHERIVLATDSLTGLQAIIAIYSTARGPGVRRLPVLEIRVRARGIQRCVASVPRHGIQECAC
jgi:hypothetical protein